ncbi:unnamed protein product [Trichobilharzia szidati]|nr:unnamed protein product [Trichobilharzia szidati]
METTVESAIDATVRILDHMLKYSSRADYASDEFKELTKLFVKSYFAVESPKHVADSYRLWIACNVLSSEKYACGVAKIFVDLGNLALCPQHEGRPSIDEKYVTLLASLQSTLCNYVELSISLAEAMCVQKAYMGEISRILSFCAKYIGSELERKITFIAEVIIKSLYNFSCHDSILVVNAFRNLHLTDLVLSFTFSKNKDLQIASYMFLTYIYGEDDQSTHVVEFFTFSLLPNITVHSDRVHGYKCEEILKGLRLLASNEKNLESSSYYTVLQYLKLFLNSFKGKALEETILILWILSFSPGIKNEINKEFKDDIKNLAVSMKQKQSEYSIESLKAIYGLLWQLNEDDISVKSVPKVNSVASPDEHIMVSYSHKEKDMAVELIKHLKEKGYKVWIDAEDMKNTDNILDGMAEAVEKAYVVCVLFSENYKRSPYTKREIEYAFKLGKPLIFLRAQPDYKPDSWLGLMLGTQVYIDISGKYPFEKYFGDLCRRLDKYLPKTGIDCISTQSSSANESKG